MKKLLVPFNFDENARLAFDAAIRLAEEDGRSITLARVINVPVLANAEQIEPFDLHRESILSSLRKISKSDMLREVSRKRSDIQVNVKVLVGAVVHEIINYAQTSNYDMMILGVTGNTFDVEDHYFATLTDRLVHKSKIPVLIVKKKMGPSLKRAVLADALSGDTGELSARISRIHALFDLSKVDIVRVNTTLDFMSQDVFDQRVAAFRERGLLADCGFHSINFASHGDGLVYYAAKTGADLIIVGEKYRSMLRRWIIGEDLAEKVMDATRLPVLVL